MARLRGPSAGRSTPRRRRRAPHGAAGRVQTGTGLGSHPACVAPTRIGAGAARARRRSEGRWWSRSLVAVVAAASVAVPGASVLLARPAGAAAERRVCSLVPFAVEVEGTVVSIDKVEVTYEVDEVDELADGGGWSVAPGDEIAVSYPDPPQPLEIGESYRVAAWDDDGGLRSRIAEAEPAVECGISGGTTALDGSYLVGPGLDRRAADLLVAVLPWALAVAALVAVSVVVARRRRASTA